MPAPDPAAEFVRDALQRGLPEPDIRAALRRANWTTPEIDAALASWTLDETAGVVPSPKRSGAAWDALFYALLFVFLGMVVGNVLALAFGQINFRIPEPGDTTRSYALSGQRWSMAALIVFTPAFWWFDRRDARAVRADPSRRFGTIRRWLSAIAIFAAATALMGDALYLIYSFLDGAVTARFLAKSASVAVIAGLILLYFRQDRRSDQGLISAIPTWALTGLAILMLALALMTIGGPAQGRMEQRDRDRLSDLRTLSRDVSQCEGIHKSNPPEVLNPLDCARNPGRLTGYAHDITYQRLSDRRFRLCIDVEDPHRVSGYNSSISGNTVCIDRGTG